MEWVDRRTLKISKRLNELDKLLLRFVRILEKYFEYVVTSGYVAILFGRARATEDIDILVKDVDEEKFEEFWKEVTKHFWCLNAETPDVALKLLREDSIRFAMKGEIIPNIELKACRNVVDFLTISERIKVVFKNNQYIFIPPLEMQIVYKEEVLKSEKDLEDALHLREVFKEKIDEKKLEEYRKAVKSG